MKKYLNTALILALICAFAAALLGFVNFITEPRIREYEESKVKLALEEVSNGYEVDGEKHIVEGQNHVEYWYLLKNAGKPCGCILGLKANGYGGELSFVAGFDANGKILSVKMIDNSSETPGLGQKSSNPDYMNMFIGTGSTIPVPVKKNMLSESDAAMVSGASLTFGGISSALSAGSDFVRTMKEVK